ncbi:cation diffusion facilitator family transporter [Arenibaculum sp.]|jgi:ferrous-iron efflux pump FieF|uniref:cation diffusion facilitator family transporter n=1 Tax=Arenibaculum sp. TaxID=2865862 RepID=UPI002E0F366E|nr:cation diffusion facilitator family transporter [Arenibaculum sp.]
MYGLSEAGTGDDHARLRRTATYASVAVACVLILSKFAAYLLTESVSLLASLIDSSMDLLGSVVILFGVRQALRPPDKGHRFGHGKAEPLAALAQAAFVTGSGVFLIYEAINRLFRPTQVQESWVGIAVMVFAMVLTLGLVAFQSHVVRRTGSLAVDADSLHYRGDLLMNLAVVASLLLTGATGWVYFDPLFAFAIAAFLMRGAWSIARGSLDVLMDRELPQTDREQIKHLVLAHRQTRGMHDLRTRNAGSSVFIELHLELDSHLTLAQAHDVTDEVERILLEAYPNAEVLVHQEPAGLEDERLDARLGGRT